MIRPLVLFHLFLLIVTVFVVSSCASKKYTKKGLKYEQLGLKAEASEYYHQALLKNFDNIEAKLGLKRTGQVLLDEKLNKFSAEYQNNNNAQAIDAYLSAEQYYNSVSKLGIDLNFPSQHKQYYEEVKDLYLEEKYVQSIDLLDRGNFDEAKKTLENILSLNPNYRDSKTKLEIAICEPKYINVIQLIEANKYRTAYSVIKDIEKASSSYKDIQSLQEECLEKGSIALVISSTLASRSNNEITQQFLSNIINSLQQLNNPFLKIIENSSTNVSASQTILLNYSISDYSYSAGNLDKKEAQGWIKNVMTNKETGEKKTDYSKTVYYMCEQNRSLKMVVNYKINDKKTGEILSSNSFNVSTDDKVKYAMYDGNVNNLVSGSWKNRSGAFNSKEDIVNDNFISNMLLQSQLNANKTIKDYNILLQEALDKSVSTVSHDIQTFLTNE